jgi:hypothetical protein
VRIFRTGNLFQSALVGAALALGYRMRIFVSASDLGYLFGLVH